jgi:hypothetical protein
MPPSQIIAVKLLVDFAFTPTRQLVVQSQLLTCRTPLLPWLAHRLCLVHALPDASMQCKGSREYEPLRAVSRTSSYQALTAVSIVLR